VRLYQLYKGTLDILPQDQSLSFVVGQYAARANCVYGLSPVISSLDSGATSLFFKIAWGAAIAVTMRVHAMSKHLNMAAFIISLYSRNQNPIDSRCGAQLSGS